MSIGNRIRVVGAVGTLIALVVVFSLLSWVGSLFELSQGLQAVLLAGAGMMGILLMTGLCFALAFSADPDERRPAMQQRSPCSQ